MLQGDGTVLDNDFQAPPLEEVFEDVPDAVLNPTHHQQARISAGHTEAGTNFIQNEILNNIDQVSREVLFGFQTESFQYALTLTAYIYIYGSKRDEPIPGEDLNIAYEERGPEESLHFLKKESRKQILNQRYIFGLISNIERKDNGVSPIDIVNNYMMNSENFLSIETFQINNPEQGMPENITNFLNNREAKFLFQKLKEACFSDLHASDFITNCYQRACQTAENMQI